MARPAGYLARRFLDECRETLSRLFWTALFRLRFPWAGSGLEVHGWVTLRSPGRRIELGRRVQLISSSWRATAGALSHGVRLRTFLPEARIVVGDGVGLNGTSITARSKTIAIGSGTMVGPNCSIVDSDFHAPWPPEARRGFLDPAADASVTIGRDVWIGMNCLILKGVVIGDNSVIAAGSVVVGEIPPDCLAAGNPAKVVKRYRG